MVTFNVDSLDFEDDEEARFGSNTDYATRFDSANSRLELEDLTNETVGYVPQDVGTDLVGGKYAQTVAEGKALADDGNVYDSIQMAVNNASSYVKIGPGGFRESVTIDTAGLTLQGSGDRTNIHGRIKTHIEVTASNVTVANVSIRSAGNSQTNGIRVTDGSSASDCHFNNITVEGVNGKGVKIQAGKNHIISNCTFISCNGPIRTRDSIVGKIIAVNNTIENCVTAFNCAFASDSIIANNIISDVRGTAITIFESDDCIIIGNRIRAVKGRAGILIFGKGETDNIVANNRISSNQIAIENNGVNTLLDANLTT